RSQFPTLAQRTTTRENGAPAKTKSHDLCWRAFVILSGGAQSVCHSERRSACSRPFPRLSLGTLSVSRRGAKVEGSEESLLVLHSGSESRGILRRYAPQNDTGTEPRRGVILSVVRPCSRPFPRLSLGTLSVSRRGAKVEGSEESLLVLHSGSESRGILRRYAPQNDTGTEPRRGVILSAVRHAHGP